MIVVSKPLRRIYKRGGRRMRRSARQGNLIKLINLFLCSCLTLQQCKVMWTALVFHNRLTVYRWGLVLSTAENRSPTVMVWPGLCAWKVRLQYYFVNRHWLGMWIADHWLQFIHRKLVGVKPPSVTVHFCAMWLLAWYAPLKPAMHSLFGLVANPAKRKWAEGIQTRQ